MTLELENSQLKVLSLWVLGTGWNNIYLISIMIAMFDIYDLWKHLKLDGGLEIVSLSGYLIAFNILNSSINFSHTIYYWKQTSIEPKSLGNNTSKVHSQDVLDRTRYLCFLKQMLSVSAPHQRRFLSIRFYLL